MPRRRYDVDTGIVTNNWSVFIEDGDVKFSMSIKDATKKQEAEFRAKLAQYVTTPQSDDCKKPESMGGRVGSLSWYGGPLAMRGWVLKRCKACGSIHGWLTTMA